MLLRRRMLVVCVALSWVLSSPEFDSLEAQEIQAAGDLLVELDAGHKSAGEAVWENTASDRFADFIEVGDPFVEMVEGVPAVTFNTTEFQDAYQSEFSPPDGLVGLDPTRSIEVWAYNPQVASEETLIAWGQRGGPDGSNMSFNYGTHGSFGAVGHWGGAGPDLGWNDAGGAPAPGQWHHLVYTYDGTTTRVYSDGCLVDEVECETNLEKLDFGVIDTFPKPLMTLAAQIEPDGFSLNFGLRGTLSLGRVRVHDGVLSSNQIQNNFDIECAEFCPPPGTCECDNCPEEDFLFKDSGTYKRQLRFSGFPLPSGLAVTQPAGATITLDGRLVYDLPDPEPATFNVTVVCTNDEGDTSFGWQVTLVDPPSREGLEIAGDLFVELHASHATAGSAIWLNSGTLGDFTELGDPVATVLGPEDSPAVSFNGELTDDAYQSFDEAPEGLIGVDPTRTIEVWAFNPEITDEETLVAWGRRGGPDGSNMSFNYGLHGNYGAVGHWGGGGPDIGWVDNVFTPGAPFKGEWHHLVYTYDGDATTTTRVYADGALMNSEFLGTGTIDTWGGHPIMLAVQIVDAAGSLDFGPREGVLSLGQVRIHDEVLTPSQIFSNFNAEREFYGVGPTDSFAPVFLNVPEKDSFCEGSKTYSFVLEVDAVPPATLTVDGPDGATITETGFFTYTIPDPQPSFFDVQVTASNLAGEALATWAVIREEVVGELQIAGELFVDLDASDKSAGSDFWVNDGSLKDFVKVGDPQVVTRAFVQAVSFNEGGRSGDAYQSFEDAPDGLVGLDPTRTIEVWVHNPNIPAEETLVAWGQRGGPAGSNMSFNYGTHAAFGAVGHWGGPDLGWQTVPAADEWHHLVYTYDGTTTRVYADGVLANSEVLGEGAIDTHPFTKITLAAQIEPDGVSLNEVLLGSLAIARVRVHDEVLSDCQVLSNYLFESGDFEPPPCPEMGDPDFADTHCTGIDVVETGSPIGVTHRVTATGVDDTGDPILYTFVADNGVDPPTVIGPTENNEAGFILADADWSFQVTVADRAECDDQAADATCIFGGPGILFRRGDTDTNGRMELTDAIGIFNFLFITGIAPSCFDAADADDNSAIELTDGIRILNVLFLGFGEIPGPGFQNCGVDPTDDAFDPCVYDAGC